MKKTTVIVVLICILILEGCTNATITNNVNDTNYDEVMQLAKTTPYGPYPELITYTVGKMTSDNNSNMPLGDSYEDNAYTRYIKSEINVQNEDLFEATDAEYGTCVSMAIATGNLPDIMVVSDYDDLALLVQYDMIENLSESYENCASDRIKDIYNSYGSDIMDIVTFDGKMMAIPETNITDGPNLVWLRKDWMDELGLEAPKNIDDVGNIVQAFIEKDPGNNGEGNTVGLVCDTSLTGECGYSSEYLLDVIFANYGAFPKQWIMDDTGDVVYGSVTDEARNALIHINSLYNTGIIDKNFLLRTTSNIIELIEYGKCGSFFGPWWAPNNPLINAVANDPNADWEPYLIATDDDITTSYHSQNPSYKYIVVRKGYEHPEIAAKIVSIMFDKIRYECDDSDEFVEYFQLNVEPTARPLSINVDYNNALSLCYGELDSCLNMEKDSSELKLLEKSYYTSCKAYLQNEKMASPDQWAAYASRIKACSLISQGNIKKVPSLYFGTTKTMQSEWWKLREKENQAYLKIVSGEEPISYFDEFVEHWYSQGGTLITEEVKQKLIE